jgi:hypothetical protein
MVLALLRQTLQMAGKKPASRGPNLRPGSLGIVDEFMTMVGILPPKVKFSVKFHEIPPFKRRTDLI